MKQVKFRSVLLLLLIVLLGLGLALFCLRYTFRGEAWASFSANGHAYTDGVVRTGQVLDRNGTVLYDGPSGVYHEDSALRQATLHAVGDQLGNISTSALEAFQSRLIGFDPLTGTLSGGHKVYLTIDADLSRTAWEALDGRKGVAAVYNYQTGDILCMVSNPSFDPADPPEISDDDSDYEGVYLNRLLSVHPRLRVQGGHHRCGAGAAARCGGAHLHLRRQRHHRGSGHHLPLRPRGDGSLRRICPLLQRGVCPAGGGAGG